MSCNELISNNKQGQIIIEKIIKDNKEFSIKEGSLTNNNIISLNNDNSKYKLEITYRDSTSPNLISYLEDTQIRNNIRYEGGKMYIPVCIPNSFIVTITEVCCVGSCTSYELTSNYATKTLVISEPLKMKVYINGIYADVLSDWDTGWKDTTNNAINIKGWDNILSKTSYESLKFPSDDDIDLWETLIQTEFPLDEDGNIDLVKKKFLIEKFKMKTLFDINKNFNLYTAKDNMQINIEIVDGTEPFITVINCNQDNENDFNKINKRVYLKELRHNISSNAIYNYPTLTYNKKSIFEDDECSS